MGNVIIDQRSRPVTVHSHKTPGIDHGYGVPGYDKITVETKHKRGIRHEKRTAYVSTYKKVAQNNPFNHYRLNITRPVNLKPSLVRWQYIGDDGQTHFMTIYDHPIIRKSWNEATPPTRAQIQELLDNLDEGFFTIPVKTDKGTVNKRYNIIPGTLENTEAEIVLGNMYKNVFGINNESLADIMQ